MSEQVLWFDRLGMTDVGRVGGKNASLGEMISHLSGVGVKVPGGFATTASAFREFLAQNNLATRIDDALRSLDTEDVTALAATGEKVRQWVMETPFPPALDEAISAAYHQMEAQAGHPVEVAVRSSATAEDLPEASFAGQQETFLNVRGLEAVKRAVHHVFASLYNDRAIAYRVHHSFAHDAVALSAGIQRMVRSDIGSSGVLFTLDTESGFRDVVFITAAYGLGEMVVQGAVNPDEFYVHKLDLVTDRLAILRRILGTKRTMMIYGDAAGSATTVVDVPEKDRRRFALTDSEVEALAKQAVLIEKHYGRPMDIEWGKDGLDGELYILQARPETVKSRTQHITRYHLHTHGQIISEGRAIGQKIGAGVARVLHSVRELDKVRHGDVLVTDMTDPDWEPIMKRAAAIVTNRGGRTCHAAILARELGIPAVVGCIDATSSITDGAEVTVSCAEGDVGYVYAGRLSFEKKDITLDSMPPLPFKIMMNIAHPDHAFDSQFLPNAGVGLARLEFIINRNIGIHPKALLNYAQLNPELRATIDERIAGYSDPVNFYIEKLSEGIATIAAAFYPKPVIVRLSDFKSNEYANLVGGRAYEPTEENPMLGFRGASRYISQNFRECFDLECVAIRRVREDRGLTNVEVMIPFVRTVDEARQVVDLLAINGLKRGEHGLRVVMMCEVPSNALLAEEFLQYFDGFSIGSNDLTQLTLGLDRDSGLIASLFDERDPAVLALLSKAIQACRSQNKYVGICGQGPSDHPDFAKWLVDEGISSISLNPDTVIETWMFLAGESISATD